MMEQLFSKIDEVIIRQKYLQNIDKVLDLGLINIIVGPRRVGKSCFLYSVIDYLIKNTKLKKTQIFYVNKEWREFDNVKTYNDLVDLFEKSNINTNEIFFVGLDEIQEVEGFEKFVLDIFSKYKKAKVYVTGSNSKLLSSKYATLLSGRYREQIIYPLTFEEFLQFSKKEANKKTFYEYLEFGGLPKIPLINDTSLRYDYLNGIYNTVFTKDVVEFFGIRNVSLLRKINMYLFKELGNYFTAQNIKKYFKSQDIKVSVDTVLNYLDYSKSAFLFNDIQRYDLKGKKTLEINSKIYAFDLGIRNAIAGFSPVSDIEKLLELVVLNHLLADGYDVKVGNMQDKEIDFIAKKDNEIKYIQVCYLLSSKDVVDREFGNLLAIKDNYEKIVLSLDDFVNSDYKGIKHYNILDWII
ncbi:ATP-binding protein [Candidatus Absconditicoccus praedator]|uniref:ATP-binding protein n=1 Tax=Candidatus Absconditicoccus praedator TaxID=2735562 RepID=UPI001E438654|nr:ATP-binding protein [Candidatus Absconditicoccus praedator]UFX82764.1 ATP-binding protein [Candidatus Absconditicoccus praedator]